MTASDDLLLVRAADRAADRSFYLAGAFKRWRAARHRSAADLLAYLLDGAPLPEYPEQELAKLALCRLPTDRADAKQIAARYGINPDRLEEVIRDAQAAPPAVGRPSGEDHPRAVLTADLVREMRRRVLAGASFKSVAQAEGFPVATVRDAVVGNTWPEIIDPPTVAVKLRRWSREDLDYLAEHQDDTAPDVAAALGRTAHAVRQKRSERGL